MRPSARLAVASSVQYKAMIITRVPSRAVDCLDALADQSPCREIEGRVGDGTKLARRYAVAVNRQHMRRVVQCQLVRKY